MTLSTLNPSKSKLATYALSAFLVGILLVNSTMLLTPQQLPLQTNIQSSPSTLSRFTSYSELRNFVITHQSSSFYPYSWKGGMRGSMVMFDSALSAAEGSNQVPGDYSTTNIQVEGVDEADLVKTDGLYIYLVSENKVHIIRAYPSEEAELVSTITLEGYIMNIYINGDKLIILQAGDYGPILYEKMIAPEPYPYPYLQQTVLHVYDVNNRANPTLDRTIKSEGSLVDTRMIGDYVYLITQQSNILYNDTEIWLPIFRDGEEEIHVEADMIYYHNVTDNWFSYTHIISVDTQSDEEIGHETFLMGGASTLYASLDNIYLTGYSWNEDGGATKIFKISVDGRSIEYTADGTVPGTVLNQFSLDEHNGYFRIVTQSGYASQSGEYTSQTELYILNNTLDIVGEVNGLAPGENLHSVRFMGNRAYLVTFKKVDPLFAIDVSDPENPQVMGKLKIPGFSDYLHPYDENILIGIGKETVEAEDPNRDFAWYQGIKISLFDVSDIENPQELAKIEIGDRGSDTPALREHKSVLFDKERNLLVIPILEAQIDEEDYSSEIPDNAYGDYVYQGAYLFDVSPEGISLRGRVTQIDDPEEFIKSGWYHSSDYTITRSLYIDDVLYTISSSMLQLNSLDDLSQLGRVDLN